MVNSDDADCFQFLGKRKSEPHHYSMFDLFEYTVDSISSGTGTLRSFAPTTVVQVLVLCCLRPSFLTMTDLWIRITSIEEESSLLFELRKYWYIHTPESSKSSFASELS